MNRRQMLSAIATGTAAAGVKGSTVVDVAKPADKPALILIRVRAHLSADTALRLRNSIQGALKDTPFEGVRVLVLEESVAMQFLDKTGAELLPKEALEA